MKVIYRIYGLPLVLLLGGMLLLAACSQAPPPELQSLQSTVDALGTRQAETTSALATQALYIEYLFTRPAPVITPADPNATPTPYLPVIGDVQIEDGRCCVGGTSGEPLLITLSLPAQSPLADVTEMRVAVGGRFLSAVEMEAVPWEPYQAQKQVTIDVPLNWSGSYASVQFRDALGNLSALVYDDISVEGS